MRISKLIQLLEKAKAENGDLRVDLFDRRGDKIQPRKLETCITCKGGKISETLYLK